MISWLEELPQDQQCAYHQGSDEGWRPTGEFSHQGQAGEDYKCAGPDEFRVPGNAKHVAEEKEVTNGKRDH